MLLFTLATSIVAGTLRTSIQLVQPRSSTCKLLSNKVNNTELLVQDHNTARRKLFTAALSSTSDESTCISRTNSVCAHPSTVSGPSEITSNSSTDSDLVCVHPHPLATVSEPSFNAYAALQESLSHKRRERCSPFVSPQVSMCKKAAAGSDIF